MNPLSFGTNTSSALPLSVTPSTQTHSSNTPVSNLQTQVDKANQLVTQELNKNHTEEKTQDTQTADIETKKESKKIEKKSKNLNFEQAESKTDRSEEKKKKLITHTQVTSKKEEIDETLQEQREVKRQLSVEEKNALCKNFFTLCTSGDLVNFKKLFFEYAPLSSKLKDPLGLSLLHYAAGRNKIEFIKFLIEQEVDIEAKNYNGLTPLSLSLRRDETIQAAELLVEKNAKIDSKNLEGITPIHLACRYGRNLLLLRMIKIINDQVSGGRRFIAGSSVHSLLSTEDDWKQMPAHYAVLNNKVTCLQTLINNGARIDAPDALNMTPFLSAMSVNSVCILTFLKHPMFLSDPKHLSACNKDGDNAIHFAVCKMVPEQLDWFLQELKGILHRNNPLSNQTFSDMINKENNLGITPYSLTLDTNLKEVLAKHGAMKQGIDKRKVKCKICTDILFNSLFVACGHPVCRLCFHTWKIEKATKVTPCPTCNQEIRLVQEYNFNSQLNTLLKVVFNEESAKREALEKKDPLACMLRNLDVFGKAFNKSLVLDSNNKLALKLDNEFLLDIAYVNKSAYLITPLLSIPTDSSKSDVALKMYQALFDLLTDGWINAFVNNNNKIVCYMTISMEEAPDTLLQQVAKSFKLLALNWREIISTVVNPESKPLNNTFPRPSALVALSQEMEAQIEKSFESLNTPSLNAQTVGLGWTLSSSIQYVINKQSSPWTFQDTENKISFTIKRFPIGNKIRLSSCLISGLPPLTLDLYQKLLDRCMSKEGTIAGASLVEGVFSISNSNLMFHLSVDIQKGSDGKITTPPLDQPILSFIHQVLLHKSFLNSLGLLDIKPTKSIS